MNQAMGWILGAALLAAGCGGEVTKEPPGTSLCGVAGTTAGAECTGIHECGGANNVKPVFNCSNCAVRADTHLCEAGVCRALDIGTTGGGAGNHIIAAFGVPAEARGAKSFTVASYSPITADGSKLTCAALMSTCMTANNQGLNVGNAGAPRFTNGPADPDFAYRWSILSEAGPEQLVFIQITADDGGNGAVVAHGCTEGIEVPAGGMVTVGVDVVPAGG